MFEKLFIKSVAKNLSKIQFNKIDYGTMVFTKEDGTTISRPGTLYDIAIGDDVVMLFTVGGKQ